MPVAFPYVDPSVRRTARLCAHYKRYLVSALLCAAVIFTPSSAWARDASLFDRLGGADRLHSVVHRLLERAHSEAQTKRSFEQTDLQRIEDKLYEQLCELSEGPCAYSGDDMKLVHQGLEITHAEFYGLVQQLREELDAAGVDSSAKNELLARLAPLRGDIVTKP